MDEISDEQSSYEEYQALTKAIINGAEQLEGEIGHTISVWHFSELNGMKLRVENPKHLFIVYHRTAKPPGDHENEKVVWDLEVEYNQNKVPLGYLVKRLEVLWNELRMLNEGGA